MDKRLPYIPKPGYGCRIPVLQLPILPFHEVEKWKRHFIPHPSAVFARDCHQRGQTGRADEQQARERPGSEGGARLRGAGVRIGLRIWLRRIGWRRGRATASSRASGRDGFRHRIAAGRAALFAAACLGGGGRP